MLNSQDFLYFFLCSLMLLYFFNFLLNKIYRNSKTKKKKQFHKKLLTQGYEYVPTSGFLYFSFIFIIIFFLNFNHSLIIIFAQIITISILFALIGFCSDVEIINSPKIRIFFQIILITICVIFLKSLNVEVRISLINEALKYEIFRVFFVSFLLLILANGANLIDGTNLLAPLNFFIIIIFLITLSENFLDGRLNYTLTLLFISLLIFIPFNFFGKNFLGDGGTYGLAIFLGLIIVHEIAPIKSISPYFIVNLLFYPAFENFFSILRRILSKKKSYIADNKHFHHLLFLYFQKKFFFLKKYIKSSLVGLVINIYFLFSIYIGYCFIEKTNIQLIIIIVNILLYLSIYYLLLKNLKIRTGRF